MGCTLIFKDLWKNGKNKKLKWMALALHPSKVIGEVKKLIST